MLSRIQRSIGYGGLALVSLASMCWGQTTYSACDLNKDGVVNSADVTLAINMALGTSNCTASIEGANTCTVITVQRVVNASDGGTCITYNTHQVTLSWTASVSSGVTAYDVYRSQTAGGPYTQVGTVNVSSSTPTSYIDTSVSAGQTYYYVVTAVGSGGQSGYSSQVSATIPTP